MYVFDVPFSVSVSVYTLWMTLLRCGTVLFSLFAGDGHWIQQCDMDSLILTLEGGGHVPKPVKQLFARSSTVSRSCRC